MMDPPFSMPDPHPPRAGGSALLQMPDCANTFSIVIFQTGVCQKEW